MEKAMKIFEKLGESANDPSWSAAWLAGRLSHLPSGQNGRHFTDDSFRCIFVNEIFCILKFVLKGPIDNNHCLV